jgi:hypothetical protein
MAATWSAEKALVEIIRKKTNNPTLAKEARMGHPKDFERRGITTAP